MVEEGTKVSLEDFASNSDLKNKVKDGVKGLFQCFLKEASWQGGNVEDLIWSFGKQGIFPPLSGSGIGGLVQLGLQGRR